jgi:hypothetical protein
MQAAPSSRRTPLLSAILVAGTCRERSQGALDALCEQTALESMEVVVVDLAPEETPRLVPAPGARTTYLDRPGAEWASARAESVRAARGEVVAFLEDHCHPAADWASSLIESHRDGRWAAVTYAFTNANPRTYVSRAGFIAEYGIWAHPTPRRVLEVMPGSNISYRRELLLTFGGQLEELMDADFNLQDSLRRLQLEMIVEPRARAAHEGFETLPPLCRANFEYCRAMAAARAQTRGWGRSRRVLYAAAAPVYAPAVKAARLARSLRSRPKLWGRFLAALPVVAAVYGVAAIGEGLGYLRGPASARHNVTNWELNVRRSAGAPR